MVSVVDPIAVRVRGRNREAELDRRVVHLANDLEAGVREHLEHAMVVRAHLGDESANARSGRQLDQLFQQARADAAAVQRIVDDERDLGHLRLAEAVVCPHRDNEPIPRTDQRPTACPSASR